jgi:hypothetical protein
MTLPFTQISAVVDVLETVNLIGNPGAASQMSDPIGRLTLPSASYYNIVLSGKIFICISY